VCNAFDSGFDFGAFMTSDTGEHIVSYPKLGAVYAALLVLTAATVAITRIDLGAVKVWAALAIACLKSGLVIAFFMHMKYEARLFRIIFFVALVTLAIFIGFTFFDVFYR
jgi:cytochrome c oxidase subunit IV